MGSLSALLLVTAAGCGSPLPGGDMGAHCGNGVKDSDESDLDCGGSCTPCGQGKMCLRGADCLSASCVNNLCLGGSGEAGMATDSGAPDLATPVIPDLATPVILDLSTPGCVNNQQCMVLPHATGMCGPNMTCVISACDPGYADCDQVVANGCEAATQTDPANCGACNTSCLVVKKGTGACQTGKCSVAGCDPGFANCDGLFASGCPTATTSDILNCGACGHVCLAPNGTPGCVNGVCGIMACNQGFADCDKKLENGCEAAISSDPQNCGGCGKACMPPPNSTPACMNSLCSVGACAVGFADCNQNPQDGCEANTLSDVANCGQCGTRCKAVANGVPGCMAGACGIGMCNPLFGDCDMNPANGCEKSLAADIANCGACGMACNFANGTGACNNGQCGLISCNMGFADCDKNPANGCEGILESDPANCGQCGNVCPMNRPACANGACGVAEDFPPVYLLYLLESP